MLIRAVWGKESFFPSPFLNRVYLYLSPDGAARIFPNSYAAAWTHDSRVAPDWDISDALPTELQRRGGTLSLIARIEQKRVTRTIDYYCFNSCLCEHQPAGCRRLWLRAVVQLARAVAGSRTPDRPIPTTRKTLRSRHATLIKIEVKVAVKLQIS